MEMPTLANESGQPFGSGNSSFLPPWCWGCIMQVFHQLRHLPNLCLLNSLSSNWRVLTEGGHVSSHCQKWRLPQLLTIFLP